MPAPFIYDPTWDRSRLWEDALRYIKQASITWRVTLPNIIPVGPPGGKRFGSGGTLMGLYAYPDRIWVNVPQSTSPVKLKGRVWSYPGYKADRTCVGILAHEFGHHLSAVGGFNRIHWQKIVLKSKPVSGYEPIPEEAFAESMRIFILNPDLLRRARPERYGFIADKLHPLHTESWRVVLGNAPAFLIQAAENFTGDKSDVR